MPRFTLIVVAVAALGLTACGDTEGPASAQGSDDALTVEIGDFVFDPTPVQVKEGDSVVWTNTHDQPHTSSGNGDQQWDTTPLEPGDTSDPVTFEEAGTFTYVCGLHPFMQGTVEVSA